VNEFTSTCSVAVLGRDDEPFVYKNWKVQHWAENSRLFRYDRYSGRLTVERSGYYYVYAQVLRPYIATFISLI